MPLLIPEHVQNESEAKMHKQLKMAEIGIEPQFDEEKIGDGNGSGSHRCRVLRHFFFPRRRLS